MISPCQNAANKLILHKKDVNNKSKMEAPVSVVKSELITNLAKKLYKLNEKQVADCVNSLLDFMSDKLCQGERIEIRGIGSFERRKHKARKSRNPKTGENLITPTKYSIHFKAGKEMRERNTNAAGKPL